MIFKEANKELTSIQNFYKYSELSFHEDLITCDRFNMPRPNKRKRHLASICHAGAGATNYKRWRFEPPPASSMEESLPGPSMEEPLPVPLMEEPLQMGRSPIVEELEYQTFNLSEYEDVEEDSQWEVDESGDSDLSSDNDEAESESEVRYLLQYLGTYMLYMIEANMRCLRI